MYYRITDATHNGGKVLMKKLWLHIKPKMELTEYLTRKALDHVEIIGKLLVAAIHQAPMCLFCLREVNLSSVMKQISSPEQVKGIE